MYSCCYSALLLAVCVTPLVCRGLDRYTGVDVAAGGYCCFPSNLDTWKRNWSPVAGIQTWVPNVRNLRH